MARSLGKSDSTNGVAPAATPKPIVAKLNRELVRIIKLPDVQERLTSQGLEAVGSTPEEFEALYRSDRAKFQKIIKDALELQA